MIPFETLEAMHNHEGKNYVLLRNCFLDKDQRDWIKYELPKYCRFAKEWNVTSLWACRYYMSIQIRIGILR